MDGWPWYCPAVSEPWRSKCAVIVTRRYSSTFEAAGHLASGDRHRRRTTMSSARNRSPPISTGFSAPPLTFGNNRRLGQAPSSLRQSPVSSLSRSQNPRACSHTGEKEKGSTSRLILKSPELFHHCYWLSFFHLFLFCDETHINDLDDVGLLDIVQ